MTSDRASESESAGAEGNWILKIFSGRLKSVGEK